MGFQWCAWKQGNDLTQGVANPESYPCTTSFWTRHLFLHIHYINIFSLTFSVKMYGWLCRVGFHWRQSSLYFGALYVYRPFLSPRHCGEGAALAMQSQICKMSTSNVYIFFLWSFRTHKTHLSVVLIFVNTRYAPETLCVISWGIAGKLLPHQSSIYNQVHSL